MFAPPWGENDVAKAGEWLESNIDLIEQWLKQQPGNNNSVVKRLHEATVSARLTVSENSTSNGFSTQLSVVGKNDGSEQTRLSPEERKPFRKTSQTSTTSRDKKEISPVARSSLSPEERKPFRKPSQTSAISFSPDSSLEIYRQVSNNSTISIYQIPSPDVLEKDNVRRTSTNSNISITHSSPSPPPCETVIENFYENEPRNSCCSYQTKTSSSSSPETVPTCPIDQQFLPITVQPALNNILSCESAAALAISSRRASIASCNLVQSPSAQQKSGFQVGATKTLSTANSTASRRTSITSDLFQLWLAASPVKASISGTMPSAKRDLTHLNESELFMELIRDVANELDLDVLCHKILVNVSILTQADRGSLFLARGPAENRYLVAKLFDVTRDTELDDAVHKARTEELRIPFGVGIAGSVAQTKEIINIRNAYELHYTNGNDFDSENVTVTIFDGVLKGYIDQDYFGGKFYGFQSIPYALPPVGQLRFQAPKPNEPWSGILDATKCNNVCPQFPTVLWSYNFTFHGAEDCLFLHVYTKSLSEKTLNPVMVWFHGGGFVWGSAYDNFGPQYLLTQDIVLVLVQYRLGYLGFLSSEDENNKIFGNYGLKDQTLALKWVQRNIKKFGGNPDRITIFGQSAGGGCVHLHVLSRQSRGLFHRGIMQSGHANFTTNREDNFGKILQLTQCNSSEKILACLREKKLEDIMEIQFKMSQEVQLHVGPTIEPEHDEAFITKPPKQIIDSGEYNQVPLIMGSMADDGSFFLEPTAQVITDYTLFIPLSVRQHTKNWTSQDVLLLANEIKDFYFGHKTPNTFCDEFLTYSTDVYFRCALMHFAEEHALTSSQPVYFYQLQYMTELNLYSNYFNYSRPLAGHSDDLPYLFMHNGTSKNFSTSSNSYIGIHRMIRFWTTFATAADPNPLDMDPLIDVVWHPIKPDRFQYLEISPNMTMRTDLDGGCTQFWSRIFGYEENSSKSALKLEFNLIVFMVFVLISKLM